MQASANRTPSLFLAAKTAFPHADPALIARPQLAALLKHAKPGTCTVLVAPEGSGKTSLLETTFVAASSQDAESIAWLRLDQQDSAESLWYYLLSALGSKRSAELAGSIAREPSFSRQCDLAEDALSGTDKPRQTTLLVLEDLHFLEQRIWQSALGALVATAGARRIVATSRSSSCKTTWYEEKLIDKSDLFFTNDELRKLLRQTVPFALSESALSNACSALSLETLGWPLAVHHFLGQASQARNEKELVRAFAKARRNLAEYCLEEPFASLPPTVRAFASKTALFPVIDADFCNQLLRTTSADRMLSYLDRETALLRRNEQGRYACLPAFRDALARTQAGQTPLDAVYLYHRAGTLYEQRGDHRNASACRKQAGGSAGCNNALEQNLTPAPVSSAKPDHRPHDTPAKALSKRETTILELLASGKNASEISSETFTSVLTVRTHIKSIYRKLDAHSKNEAIEKAVLLGML